MVLSRIVILVSAKISYFFSSLGNLCKFPINTSLLVKVYLATTLPPESEFFYELLYILANFSRNKKYAQGGWQKNGQDSVCSAVVLCCLHHIFS